MLVGVSGCRSPARKVQLCEDVAQVPCHGFFADTKGCGDRTVGPPGRHESQDLDLPRGQSACCCMRSGSARLPPAEECRVRRRVLRRLAVRRPAPSPRRPRHQALGRSDRSARDSGPLRTAPRGGTTRSTRDEAPGARLSADLRRGGPPRWPDRKRPAGGDSEPAGESRQLICGGSGGRHIIGCQGYFNPGCEQTGSACGDPASHREDCERLRWLHRSASARAEVERGQDTASVPIWLPLGTPPRPC